MKRRLRHLSVPMIVLVMSLGLSGCLQGGNGVNCVQSPMLQTTVCFLQ